MNLWSHILVSVGTAAGAVLVTFLTILVRHGAKLLVAGIAHVRNAVLRDALEGADREAERLALTFVTALNQSFVNDLKETGGWNAETAAEVKAHAVDLLQGALSKTSQETLSLARDDLSGLLGAYVEHAVALAPNRQTRTEASPPTELAWPPAS